MVIRRFIRSVITEGSLEDHLRSRGVDPNRIRVIIDEESGLATFLLFNLSGQLVGFQQYNPHGSKDATTRRLRKATHGDIRMSELMKYFTYVGGEGRKKKLAVWGLESVHWKQPYIFVTEGIFDAVKIQNAGHPAIAVLSNDPMPLKPWLRALNKHVIAILDSDGAGSRLSRIADESHAVPAPYKDVGDMPQGEVNEFIDSVLE